MKYSKEFDRDFNWYLKNRKLFNFDGSLNYVNKKGEELIQYSKDGVSAKEAFYLFDSNGIIKPTRHSNLLKALYKTKGSINFHIKMWAEGRADGSLPKVEFSIEGKEHFKNLFPNNFEDYKTIEEEFNLLSWMLEAVEKQKVKYY